MSAPDPLAVPGRIAFVGDVHAELSWSERVVNYCADQGVDVIVQLGDFGYLYRRRFVQGLTAALARVNLPWIFIDGNHDDQRYLSRLVGDGRGLGVLSSHLWHARRGTRWVWDGVRFTALGGAHSVDVQWRIKEGQLWQPEETISAEQAATAIAGGTTDVLLSHDCPYGVVIPGLAENAWRFPYIEIQRAEEHRMVLRRVVDELRPRSIWHGHYHPHHHEQDVDLGYGTVRVTGLDCNGSSLVKNVYVIALDDLRPEVMDLYSGFPQSKRGILIDPLTEGTEL